MGGVERAAWETELILSGVPWKTAVRMIGAGVTPGELRDVHEAGFPVDDWVEARSVGITPEEIIEMDALGFTLPGLAQARTNGWFHTMGCYVQAREAGATHTETLGAYEKMKNGPQGLIRYARARSAGFGHLEALEAATTLTDEEFTRFVETRHCQG